MHLKFHRMLAKKQASLILPQFELDRPVVVLEKVKM